MARGVPEPGPDAAVAMASADWGGLNLTGAWLRGRGLGGAAAFGAAKFGCGGKWVWAAPRRVAVVALAVPPGPVNVRAEPGEDGALEPGLAGVGAGGGRAGDRPCRR